jgi:hypothetical protein
MHGDTGFGRPSETAAAGQGRRGADTDLLDLLVQRCQSPLSAHGYRCDGGARSSDYQWVRYSRPARAAGGAEGALVLLLMHAPQERAVLLEACFTALALGIETPCYRWRYHYEPAAAPALVAGKVEASLARWLQQGPTADGLAAGVE